MEIVDPVELKIFSFLVDPRAVYLSKEDESLFSVFFGIAICTLIGDRASAFRRVNDFKKMARERFNVDLNLPLED